MKYIVGLVLGVILTVLLLFVFRNSLNDFLPGVTLTNKIDKNVQLEERCFIIQNHKVVGELYTGMVIKHISNDELKRFSIDIALDKYNTLKTKETDEYPFSEIRTKK
ncbi:hypothetical protein LY01_02417 [Nonlabens xylanidelens]|uniref:Uncharacterized protein n=1 Tax=Nonlabens xylanidelens TaxID=191564 RepID=A0A2S6IHE8_9FLAO|nr:hypothetical protein [Nonlabens xylanidelens]PPK93634.1 hypothetical protein LY01_02417 [Nonlabens xylanidelens]PQJ17783.1 hypothetical protein BST94_12185 [Nonlabens xylanidelens]